MKIKKCKICKNKEGVKTYKSSVFGHIDICERCVREYGGRKEVVEAYELCNVVFK